MLRVPIRRGPAAGLALGLLALAAGCKKPPELAAPEPPGVTVVRPTERPYAPVKEFTGRLVTKDPVKVSPQVTGLLLDRRFTEGQAVVGRVAVLGLVVREGTLLYEIDPVQFEADVKKAEADLKRADADIANWTAQIKRDEAEAARVTAQYTGGAGSKSDKDKADATVDVDKAQLAFSKASKEAAEATLAKARENLQYCKIYAPADGLVGRSQVAPRSTVTAYQTVLTEVYPVDPIYAEFDVDELTSLWYRDQILAGAIADARDKGVRLKCWIRLKNETAFSRESTLDYVDPVINRSTGTRMVRATFPNPPVKGMTGPDGKEVSLRALSGGDSVRVRVEAGRPQNKLMVPETVVMSSQRRKFVFVLNAADEAEGRDVVLGPSIDGWQVVESGLTTADRVVASNLLRVRPGVKVKVLEGK